MKVFVDEGDINRQVDAGKVKLTTKKPIIWEAPQGALTLFTIGGAVHGSPVADFSRPEHQEPRAFFRQRIIVDPEY